MKIAQLTKTIPPIAVGEGVVAHYYAKELTSLGEKVDVFVLKNKAYQNLETPYKLIQLRALFSHNNNAFLPQLLWRLCKYDVVHVHFPFIGAIFFATLLKKIRKNKMKLIVSYHFDLVGIGFKKRLLSFYNKFILTFPLKAADKIIVSSIDYIYNSNLVDFYEKNKEKFFELPCGVQTAYQPMLKNPSLMKKYSLTKNDKIIGFVGSLSATHYFKGVDYLITAISKLAMDNVKLMIIGDGEYKKRYQALAKTLGIDNKVIFIGFLPNQILPEHYNLFDIFVLPSINKSESFSLVLLEAMACGKPLVASCLTGVKSVVLPGENGFLVEPKNSQDIADKITYLIENERLQNDFGKRGLCLVDEKYRWPVIVNILHKLYQKI